MISCDLLVFSENYQLCNEDKAFTSNFNKYSIYNKDNGKKVKNKYIITKITSNDEDKREKSSI